MSRRGKNNVMRSIVHDATSIFSTNEQQPPKTPTNNYNPLFHYLQTMFPNYDNAVLNAVLEQEGNSIERAVEVLLAFAVPEEPKDNNINNEKEPAEITFADDFSDTEETPSNVFAVPVMPPVTSHNSGRDHVSLYEQTRKKRKATKSQRARRRQRAQAAAAAASAAKVKKVKWVPLQEFIVESENPFEALPLEPENDQLPLSTDLVEQLQLEQVLDATVEEKVEEEPQQEENNDEETQTLLTQEEIEESWENFEATQQEVEEEEDEESVQQLQSPSDSGSESEEWLHYTPSTPQTLIVEELESTFASSSSGEEEEGDEGFVVIEEPVQALSAPQEVPLFATPIIEDERSEQVVVVKLYYSASDIHRLGLTRRTLTFAKLYDYAATYLQGKCQQAKAELPRAFALTYVDDEGDVIHLCSEEELAEALRLHDDVFWTDDKQPLLRLHIKSLEAAANDGHIVV